MKRFSLKQESRDFSRGRFKYNTLLNPSLLQNYRIPRLLSREVAMTQILHFNNTNTIAQK